MASIAALAETPDPTLVPLLVGGLIEPGRTVPIPQRHGQALADWAATHDIGLGAEVLCTGLRLRGGALYAAPAHMRLPRDERPGDPNDFMGWELNLIDADQVYAVCLLEGGEITQTHEGRPVPGDVHSGTSPADRVRAAAGRERRLLIDHQTARIARDVTIRSALAQGMSVPMIASETGLGVPRIYQIRDSRR
ncbi:hypothetical protein [Streptomyces xanthochromogenes]